MSNLNHTTAPEYIDETGHYRTNFPECFNTLLGYTEGKNYTPVNAARQRAVKEVSFKRYRPSELR